MNVHELRSQTGRFIHDAAPWTDYVHLTFDDPVHDAIADRVFRDWARMLARDFVGEHVWIAWGHENQRRGAPHFHALLAIPSAGRLNGRLAEQLWKGMHRSSGWARAVRFDPIRGAAWYLSKGDDWDVNVACPRPARCRRPAGCRIAPSPW